MPPRNTWTRVVIILTVFLDLLGVSLVIPVAAPLFLSMDATIFPASASLEFRTLILGALLGVTPLVQFFSAPLLGAYSDRAGRKPVLLLSVLANGIGHFLFGAGILSGNLALLFVSRVLAGAGSGNLSAANSAMADISAPEEKVRNFGLVGMAIGFGFIVGPFVGGKLTDPSLVSWFNYATPLWVATALTLLNAILILLILPETLRVRLNRPMDALTGIRNIRRAFGMQHLRSIYAVSFLLGFGFNFFTQFFSVFLVAKFQFSTSQIGALFAYVGIWIAFTQGILARIISRRVLPPSVIRWAPLITTAVLLALAFIRHERTIYLLLPLVAMSYGVNAPNVTAIISDSAGKESQGEALGINQSMGALSMALPPILAGFAVSLFVGLPLYLSAFFVFLGWLVFVRYWSPVKPVFHEV
jgi:DHA1 family tetracycline resistance protein-like MFS transporter